MQLDHLHGFALREERPLPELDATLVRMTHEKTGLDLIWLNRKEENMTFGIAFETLPWNDTGVFHILEHSVLCGSDKYPVKEPFVELMKSSLNTFLNAMTYPDKTVYPISSRNKKDFLNLMHVYLDAVFHPLIYSKPQIFQQEGWHYELDENGTPSYKGVVFNEMKGAMASADEQAVVALNRGLFPDSPYRYVSGGDPISIPDLSYEEFIASHKKFYAPSNAYVFLDGDLDIDTVLSVLNDEYLCHYEKTERMAPPAMQSPVTNRIEQDYELPENEELAGKVRLSYGSVIGDFSQREKLIATQILTKVLCGTNQSPLSKVILSQGLAEDVSMSLYDGVAQPWVIFDIKNLAEENLSRVEQTVKQVLTDLANNGLDRNQLRAVMSNLEFKLREREFGGMPSGLLYGLSALETWLYGGDPAMNLEVGDLFEKLGEKLEHGYFEQLLRELFLENPHSCTVVLHPSHTAGEARRKAEADRLLAESSAWDENARKRVSDSQQALLAWQNSEDTPEVLATIPMLTLEDIPTEPEPLPVHAETLHGLTVLTHPQTTSGIVYTDLYFDAGFCTKEQLHTLSFLAELLGNTPTGSHSAEEIMNARRLLCGDLVFSPVVFSVTGSEEACVQFRVGFSALKHKLPQALQLVLEILTQTRFTESIVRDILKQSKSARFDSFVMAGHAQGMYRLKAQLSQGGAANEALNGYSSYLYLKDADTSWNWETTEAQLTSLLQALVCREGLTVSMTGTDDADRDAILQSLTLLPQGKRLPKAVLPLLPKCSEGIVIPADICFAEMGGSLPASGFTGVMFLASQITSLAYLWNVVRVQGGAYGVGLSARKDGSVCCYSYRDPNGSASLEAYQGAGSFLREFAQSVTDYTGFIVGTVASASPLYTPKTRAVAADADYFSHVTWQLRCDHYRQMLSATTEDLLRAADTIDEVFRNAGVCVVGGKNQLDNCKSLTSIYTL